MPDANRTRSPAQIDRHLEWANLSFIDYAWKHAFHATFADTTGTIRLVKSAISAHGRRKSVRMLVVPAFGFDLSGQGP